MAKLKVNNALWLISDTHFGHKNIIKFQQRPETHEEIMLSEWIKFVGEDDQILHLGDVFLGKGGNPLRWARIISRLPGQKFLIKGNHDKQKNALYEAAGFSIVEPFIVRGHAFTHRPVSTWYPIKGDWHTNIHGHIHGNSLVFDEVDPLYEGGYDQTKKYINLSVEVTDFKPRQLGNVWKY